MATNTDNTEVIWTLRRLLEKTVPYRVDTKLVGVAEENSG